MGEMWGLWWIGGSSWVIGTGHAVTGEIKWLTGHVM